jgi:replicative DNA helicase
MAVTSSDIEVVSENLERFLLSSLFAQQNKDAIGKISTKLFYNTKHKKIFEAMKQSETLDIESISNLCVQKKVLLSDLVGILSADYTLNGYSIWWHVEQLKHYLFGRLAYSSAKRISEHVHNLTMSGVSGIESEAHYILRLKKVMFAEKQEDIDIYERTIQDIVSPLEIIRIPIMRLYQKMGGFSRGYVSSLGALSGHNKTTFAVWQMKENIKADRIVKGHIITLEEEPEKVYRRIIADDLCLSTTDMRNKKVSREDLALASEYLKRTYGGRLITTSRIVRMEDVLQCIQDTTADQHIIDHLQHIQYPTDNQTSGIDSLMTQLTYIAKLKRENILCLCQVNDKNLMARSKNGIIPPPTSHDFFNSSRVFQASREQLTLYWRYKAVEDSGQEMDEFSQVDKGEIEIACNKSSYSDTGRVKIRYEPEYARFYEVPG